MGSVISAAADLISGLFKVTTFGIAIAPNAIIFCLFLKAMQPQTYQLSSLEGIANSFIHGKARHSSKNSKNPRTGQKSNPIELRKSEDVR